MFPEYGNTPVYNMNWIFTTLKFVIIGNGTKRDSNFYLKGFQQAGSQPAYKKRIQKWVQKNGGVIKIDYIMLLV